MLSLTRTWAVMAKEFVQLTRDRLTYAMILLLPIIQLLLFGYAINDDPRNLPTAVLVQDNGAFSRSILTALHNSGYFDIAVQARSQPELDRALERGEVQFAVIIPADFTRRVVRGDAAQILVEADATDPSATSGAVAALANLPAQALTRDLTGPLAARASGAAPFEVIVHRRYNPEAITAYNIVPGLLGVILSMTLVMMTSLGMARERERGTMETLLSTPVRPLEVMVGKLTPYVLVGLVQATVILVLARLLFNVPMSGGWIALGAGLILFIVGSLALGFLISTVAKTQLQAMQMSVFYMLPSILLSGFMFPFRGMPDWAQALGTAIPVTHFLRVVRGSLLKGVGLENAGPSLFALGLFVLTVGALAMLRYRTTLD
ncbi:MAG: ABC transporter permease [Alphaproteobacteria bacterium]|jgi:ABC-2 type transport system permease protein|uniref:ABC transporter permease n=1 Tax=unclassified Brevundimonas TaxID=2622653 RepID=UPI000DB874E2|nr:ABC transporter permease [Brevundimonas sp.]MBU1270924.1 ABC transporter permease [Alphaproteobacteria bacterium]MBJ7318465.1 ABC transporter permease [Brevundimonas sp.]MBU1519901.1 ABC transporter permease [Alphaproteobacteria bacterium]MBU2031883.1 ABC transporter permease [Alphaproteobacteria bacterium]MBU2165840.1 ABC transporter permease [Alphaproteobacteria bacterium]